MAVDYSKWPLLVEACMEWIAQRWTKSMIRAELREHFKKDIDARACQAIIKAAKDEIKRKYNIDASEYRGRQISFYELIIREKKYYTESIKVESRIKAAERLDKLFNLEGIQAEDADAIAERVRTALQEMDEHTFTEVPDHARDKLKRLRKTYNDAQREGNAKPGNGSTNSIPNETSGRSSEEVPRDETVDRQANAESKSGRENNRSESVSETTEESAEANKQDATPDSMDVEDVATFDSLPEEIRDLIVNPENDEAFKQFENRKTRRKELDD